ncbi:uncharacterized protein DAT39_012881, partial [Clarias magur]
KKNKMWKIEQKLPLLLMMFLVIFGWTQGMKNITKHYSSYYGRLCEESCATHGKDYLWCNTKNGWDYCSTEENIDSYGQPCREDHPCRTYGKRYHWCYTEAGSWGYCGAVITEPRALFYKGSNYMSPCWDDCLYDEKKKYFSCHTEEGLDFCSPLPHATYKNELCRLDHFCGTHGGSSNTWCYTDSDDDDKCGLISPGECQHIVPDPMKEDLKTVMYCTWKDGKDEKVIRFNARQDLTISTQASKWKNEIINFIGKWKNSNLSPETSYTPITSENLRFEQRLMDEGGQHSYNLQVM